MQHVVALDISSPLHTLRSYNTARLKSIPILIFKCDNTRRELQTECWAFAGSPEHPNRLTDRCAQIHNIHKEIFSSFLNA